MKLVKSLLAVSLAFSTVAFGAEKSVQKQCLGQAIQFAKAIDAVKGSDYSSQKISAKVETIYGDAAIENEEHVTYTFGDGESILEVALKVRASAKSRCIFSSVTASAQE